MEIQNLINKRAKNLKKERVNFTIDKGVTKQFRDLLKKLFPDESTSGLINEFLKKGIIEMQSKMENKE